MNHKNQWNSRIVFLLSMIGAAVGLGNIWRYSYVVYSNGGGTFFIPYIVAILIMGIPFLILEYGIGFKHKDSYSNILKGIHPKLEYLSWALVLVIYFVVIYYLVIVSWDLVYLGSSINFNWGSDASLYFVNVVGGSSNLSNMTTFLLPTTISMVIVWFSVWYISHKDLNEGIGKASKILIPLLFVLMTFIIIIIYALTLPGAYIGIETLLKPDWNMLWNINIWLAAFSQIIFSLSMGESISLTYASYLPQGSKLTDNVLIVVFANCAFEVCTAFGVFSILGYMSYSSGTPMIELISEGTGLVFVVFPRIFNVMGPIGHIIATLLFLAILFAGITSAVAVFEPMINSTRMKLNWSRKKTVTVLSIIGCLISVLFTSGISSYIVGKVDGFITEFCILLMIALQSVMFTWFYDIEGLIPILNENNRVKVGKWWIVILKYILPVFLFIMWFSGVYDLLLNINQFEIIVYSSIAISILVTSYVFTKIDFN